MNISYKCDVRLLTGRLKYSWNLRNRMNEVICMQKKKCQILEIIGLVVVVAAAIVVLPKAIKFIKDKIVKNKSEEDELDDMEFEDELVFEDELSFEDEGPFGEDSIFEETSEFVRPEPMEVDAADRKRFAFVNEIVNDTVNEPVEAVEEVIEETMEAGTETETKSVNKDDIFEEE